MKKKTSASLPDAEVFFFIATQHIPTFDKKILSVSKSLLCIPRR